MDVFGADGSYVGTVVGRRCRPLASTNGPQATRQTTTADARRGTGPSQLDFTGESLGPMPTASIGNKGPQRQTAATAYASVRPASEGEPAAEVRELWVLRLFVALSWSTLRPRLRRIPVTLVQAVTLERIILSGDESPLL